MSETIPRTARQALAMWDAGEPVPAFEVESETNEQEALWGAAFDKIAGREIVTPAIPFTRRERDVIASIVFVAGKIGWFEMVKRHVHEKSPALTIRKPGAEQTQSQARAGERNEKDAKSQENDAPGATPTAGPLPGS
jgi:hypothetical protein